MLDIYVITHYNNVVNKKEEAKTMKRYSMQYESDEVVCRSNDHLYGMASTIKTAKSYISRVRREKAQYNPRNFRIFDHFQEVDPSTDYVPCVYRED